MTGAKADERQTLLGIVDTDATLLADHPGQTVIADKNYFGRGFEAAPADAGVDLLRPARKGEAPARKPGSGSGSCNTPWPSPPPSATTTAPTSPSNDH